MNQDIYQHYRKEEEAFVDQVYNWIGRVSSYYAPITSNFLTPREALIVQQITNANEEVNLKLEGGYEGAERKRVCIYPPYYEPSAADFELALLNIIFPPKFANISHGKILGTLIGSGIERDRIGDIITDGEAWHIVVDATMSHYLINQVTKIGNVGVRLEEIPLTDMLDSIDEWDTITVIASSLRLDTLLSKVYNFSRQRAKDSVNAGLVKVNFVPMERSDEIIGEEDIVSLRRSGRFWIKSIDGVTKKDNFRLTVNVLKV